MALPQRECSSHSEWRLALDRHRAFVLQVIDGVLDLLPARRARAEVHIFSDRVGNAAGAWNMTKGTYTSPKQVDEDEAVYRDFIKRGYHMDFDLDLLETWSGMFCSDIFIMSRSSFSYVPALLHLHGAVLFQKFWHVKQPGWLEFSSYNSTSLKVANKRTLAKQELSARMSELNSLENMMG
jgi:hypothetical protein